MLRYEDSNQLATDVTGIMPDGWEINDLGPLLRPVSIKNRPELPLLSITREEGVIIREMGEQSDNHNYIPDDLSAYKLLKIGQFGMNKMKAWQGSYGVSKHDGIVSPAYYVFEFTKPIDPDFFHWAIRSKRYIAYFGEASDGVRIGQWDLSKERMKRIPFITPPIEEQTVIADFLDRKTTLIDRAIAQKQRLIELLEERRRIVIQRAVTRGLDPDVEMKDSGVTWMSSTAAYGGGEIPAHWEVRRLKTFVSVQTGVTLGKRYGAQELEEVPYLRVANVQAGHFALSNIATLKMPKENVTKYLLEVGDLLVTEGGDIDKLGRGAVWGGEIERCIHQNHVFAIRVNVTSISPAFISLIFGCHYGRNYFTRTANKTTNLASTNSTKLGEFPVAVAPCTEMEMIVTWIGEQSDNVNRAVQHQITQIIKLKEYRATLIDAAVTGKIRVT